MTLSARQKFYSLVTRWFMLFAWIYNDQLAAGFVLFALLRSCLPVKYFWTTFASTINYSELKVKRIFVHVHSFIIIRV